MSALRQNPAALSPFGMLARAFAEELLARLTPVEGAYDTAPTELLEEAGPQPADSAGRRDLQVDVRLLLELIQKQQPTKEHETEKRILEKAAKISLAQKPEAAGKTEALPDRIRQNFYQSIHQHIQINPLLRQTEGRRFPEWENAASAKTEDGLRTGWESRPGPAPSAGLRDLPALSGSRAAERRPADGSGEILPQPELRFPEPGSPDRSDAVISGLRAAAQAAGRAASELGALAAAEAEKKNEPARELRGQRADAGADREKNLPGNLSAPKAEEKSPAQAAAELRKNISQTLDREIRNQPKLRAARDIRVGGSRNERVPGGAEAEGQPEAERENGSLQLSYREENREPEAAGAQPRTQPKSPETEETAGPKAKNRLKNDGADGNTAKAAAAAQKSGAERGAASAASENAESGARKPGPEPRAERPESPRTEPAEKPEMRAARDIRVGGGQPIPQQLPQAQQEEQKSPAAQTLFLQEDGLTYRAENQTPGAEAVPAAAQRQPGKAAAQEKTESVLPPAGSGAPARPTVPEKTGAAARRPSYEAKTAESQLSRGTQSSGEPEGLREAAPAGLPTAQEKGRAEELQPRSPGQPLLRAARDIRVGKTPREPDAVQKQSGAERSAAEENVPARADDEQLSYREETRGADAEAHRPDETSWTQTARRLARQTEKSAAANEAAAASGRAGETAADAGRLPSPADSLPADAFTRQPALRAARDIRVGKTPREPDAIQKQSGAEQSAAEESVPARAGAEQLSYREETRGADAEAHRPDEISGTQAARRLARRTGQSAAADEAAAVSGRAGETAADARRLPPSADSLPTDAFTQQAALRAARDIRVGRTPREPDAEQKQSGGAEESVSARAGAEQLSYREETRGADAEAQRPDEISGAEAARRLARQTEQSAAAVGLAGETAAAARRLPSPADGLPTDAFTRQPALRAARDIRTLETDAAAEQAAESAAGGNRAARVPFAAEEEQLTFRNETADAPAFYGGQAPAQEPARPQPRGRSEQFFPSADEARPGKTLPESPVRHAGKQEASRDGQEQRHGLTFSARDIRLLRTRAAAQAPEKTAAERRSSGQTERPAPAAARTPGDFAQTGAEQPRQMPADFPGAELQYLQSPDPQPAAGKAGRTEQTESDYVRRLPDWARRFLRENPAAPAGPAELRAARSISSQQTPASAKDQVSWTAPAYAPEAPVSYRQKPAEQKPAASAPRISDAELQRTADQVYDMIQDRIRRERRRLGL